MKRLLIATTLATTLVAPTFGDTTKTTKVTILVRGAHCDECVKTVRAKLSQVKGIKFDEDDLTAGESPRYFSEPIEIEVSHASKTGIGAAAKAVAKAKTAHRKDVPPRLHLLFYTDDAIDEESVSDLREELRSVNGVQVDESGALGAFPNKDFYWVRLEPAGGAELETILAAAKKVVRVRLTEDE